MKGIGQFFDKFNNGALKEINKRVIICDILKKEINQEIPIEHITFRNKTLIIKANQIIKAEIFLKKQKIIREISKKIPNIIIENIN